MMTVKIDTPKCEECGGVTALVTGRFFYSFDAEPYTSGVEETIDDDYEGDCWVGGYECQKCKHVQGLWYE